MTSNLQKGVAVGGTTLSGLKIGSTVGTTVFPGLGSAAGAAIGATVGFVTGLFGVDGGSGSSGGKKIGEKIKRHLNNQNKLTLEKLQRDTALAIQAEEFAVEQYNALVEEKYREELKQWRLTKKERDTAFKQARSLYQDSVKAFYEQVDLNDISATMRMNEIDRQFNENRNNLNNQAQLLALELRTGKRDRRLNEALIRKRFDASIKQAKYDHKGIENELTSLKRQGEDAIKKTTRSFKQATRQAELDLAVKGFEVDAEEAQMEGEMATLKGEKQALVASAKLKQDEVLNSMDNAKAEADFAQATLQLQQDERYADAAVQTDQMRRQALMQEGAQIAKGQAGRSARKSVQGMAFASQQAQALIASAIVRADAKHLIDKNKIAQSLANARAQGKFELRSTRIGLTKASKEFEAAKYRMTARAKQNRIRGEEAKMIRSRFKFDIQEGKQTNQAIKKEYREANKAAQLDIDKLSNKLLLDQKEFQTQFIKNDLAQYDLAAQMKLSFKSLKQANKSLATQYNLSAEQLAWDQYLANRDAATQVLDKPRKPEPIDMPVPAPELVLPDRVPVDWNQIAKSMKLARKAKTPWTPANTSAFESIVNNVTKIADQAASVVENVWGGGSQIGQEAEDFFDPGLKIGVSEQSPHSIAAGFGRDISSDFSFPANLGSSSVGYETDFIKGNVTNMFDSDPMSEMSEAPTY